MDFKDLRDEPNSNGTPPNSHEVTPTPLRKKISPVVVGLSVLCGVLLVALTAVTTIMVIGNDDYTSHYQTETEVLVTYVPVPALEFRENAEQPVERMLGSTIHDAVMSAIELGMLFGHFPIEPIFGSDFTVLTDRDFLFDTVETSSWDYIDWRLIDNFVRFATSLGLLDGQVYNFAWDCGHDCPLREILRNIE